MTPEQDARVRANVMRAISNPQPRPSHRRRNSLIAFAVLSVALVSAAAWVILAPLGITQHQVWCYDSASTSSHYAVGHSFPSDTPDKEGRIALSECHDLWAVGIAGPGKVDGNTNHPVPPLVLCLNSNQTFAVFPDTKNHDTTGSGTPKNSEAFCDALGLDPPPTK